MPRPWQASAVAWARVRVHDRVQLRPRRVDRGVEAPLGRRFAAPGRAAIVADERDVVGLEAVVGNAGRRQQEAGARPARAAHRHVAGLVDVDAALVHRARRGDDRFPQLAAVVPKSGHAACRRSGKSEPSSPGATTPRSVMIPVTSRAGVTSNAGLATGVSSLGDAHRRAPLLRVEARDFAHLARGALLDRDARQAVVDGPVDRRRRHGRVEGHAVVASRRVP